MCCLLTPVKEAFDLCFGEFEGLTYIIKIMIYPGSSFETEYYKKLGEVMVEEGVFC